MSSEKNIRLGVQIFHERQLNPKIFYAPSHTFDINTLKALEIESDIRIISDTIVNDIYKMHEFYFIPKQSGHVRRLPLKLTTFCYHPNTMGGNSFEQLESFIKNNRKRFINIDDLSFKDRKLGLYDKALRNLYFAIRYIRSKLKGNRFYG
jgi:hypothetical protein